MKKFKPILGISLIVQSITFFVLCLLNIEKKKNLAKAFGVMGALGGIAGAALLVSEYKNRKKLKAAEDAYLVEFDEFDEFIDDYDELEADDEILCSFEGESAE